jgi:hypothetical protein
LAREGGIDLERAGAVAEELRERAERGELAVPEPSQELLDKLLAARDPGHKK